MSTRVVSLISSATEILHRLGLGELQVGRSHECDYPSSVLSLPQCSTPRIDTLATSGEIHRQVQDAVLQAASIYEISLESLVELQPTHLLTQTQCEVCAVSENQVEQALSGKIASNPALISLSATNLAGLWNDIQKIATALGHPERGAALVLELQEQLQAIRQTFENKLAAKPTVLCLEWMEPLMAAGNWMPELIDLAGGQPVLCTAGEHSSQFSWEDLNRVNPDVIAIMPCGFDITRSLQEIGALFSQPDFFELRAVRQGRVYIADGTQYFNRPGPRLVDSAAILGEMIYDNGFRSDGEKYRGTAWVRLDEC